MKYGLINNKVNQRDYFKDGIPLFQENALVPTPPITIPGVEYYNTATGILYKYITGEGWIAIGNINPGLWTNLADTYGRKLNPLDPNAKKVELGNDDYGLTMFRIINANDADNYQGAVYEAKGSGADFVNTLYFGKYGANYYEPTLRDSGAMITDKDLIIGTVDPTKALKIVTGGGDFTSLKVSGEIADDRIVLYQNIIPYFRALQTKSQHPERKSRVYANLDTGELYTNDTDEVITGGKMRIPAGYPLAQLRSKFNKELFMLSNSVSLIGNNFASYAWARWSFNEKTVGVHDHKQFTNYGEFQTWTMANIANNGTTFTNETIIDVYFRQYSLEPLYKTYGINRAFKILKGGQYYKNFKRTHGGIWDPNDIVLKDLSNSLLSYFGYTPSGVPEMLWTTRNPGSMFKLWSVTQQFVYKPRAAGAFYLGRKMYDVTGNTDIDVTVLPDIGSSSEFTIEDSVIVGFDAGGNYTVRGRQISDKDFQNYDSHCRIYKVRYTDLSFNDYIGFIIKPIGMDTVDFNYIPNIANYKLFAYCYNKNNDPFFIDCSSFAEEVNDSTQNIGWRLKNNHLRQISQNAQGHLREEDTRNAYNVKFFYANSKGDCSPLTDTALVWDGNRPGYKSAMFFKKAY